METTPTTSTCSYCNSNIELAVQPTMTLLCNHLVHSYCFIRVMCQDSPRFLNCPLSTCNAPLTNEALITELALPNHGHGHGHGHGLTHNQIIMQAEGELSGAELSEDTITQNIYEQYTTNEEFKAEIKAYHKQLLSTTTASNKLIKLVKERRKQLFTSLAEIKATIKESMKQNISSLRTSDIYKNFIKERRKYLNLSKKLEGAPNNISPRRLYYAFKGKPGFSRWPHLRGWRLSTHYLLNCSFYFRVRA